MGSRRVSIWGLEPGFGRPNLARIRNFDEIRKFPKSRFSTTPCGPLGASFSVPIQSQNLSLRMSLSTCSVLLEKIAEPRFEFTDFEKTQLLEAKRINHTRPKLAAKAPLQRNYSSNLNCSTSYMLVWLAWGQHLGFGTRRWASKSGQNSRC